ncbi:MAG: HsdM family class I SAM-dependent methyltransferase, partial [Promethearchaeota archaeon]
MDFTKIFPAKEVELNQFQAFYSENASIVENIINFCIKNESSNNFGFFSVLKTLSLDEWMENRTNAVKQLSILLIVLLYDIITYITRLLDRFPDFDEFLNQYQIDDNNYYEIDDTNSFIRNLDILVDKAYDIDPLASILSRDKFPLNKLLNRLLKENKICSEVLKLMSGIKKFKIYSNLLLLPYIFEICIPISRKQIQGQVFTPLDVTEFICSQNLTEKTSRILDPACGTGILLLGALEFLRTNYDSSFKVELIGIEKDSTLASIALSALCYFKRFNELKMWNFKIFNEDFFLLNRNDLKLNLSHLDKITVLMNPPYTRQEKLTSGYKHFLNRKVSNEYKDLSEGGRSVKNILSGRSGLYTYFIIHTTSLLKTGDQFGLIIPNSWLDVDYGNQIQNFLLDNYSIDSIIGTSKEKLIPNVDVNTVILTLIKSDKKLNRDLNSLERIVTFISIDRRRDLKKLKNTNLYQGFTNKNIRCIQVEQKNLYLSSKWGIFHRAPQSYYQLIQKVKNNVVTLGDVAKVRRGFTTGANDFFYVGKPGYENMFFQSSWNETTGDLLLTLKDKATIFQFKTQGVRIKDPIFVIEKEYWMHKISVTGDMLNWDFCIKEGKDIIWVPNYVIKSPKDIEHYEITEENLKYVVILISSSLD